MSLDTAMPMVSSRGQAWHCSTSRRCSESGLGIAEYEALESVPVSKGRTFGRRPEYRAASLSHPVMTWIGRGGHAYGEGGFSYPGFSPPR